MVHASVDDYECDASASLDGANTGHIDSGGRGEKPAGLDNEASASEPLVGTCSSKDPLGSALQNVEIEFLLMRKIGHSESAAEINGRDWRPREVRCLPGDLNCILPVFKQDGCIENLGSRVHVNTAESKAFAL